jgi:hypothetical protein
MQKILQRNVFELEVHHQRKKSYLMKRHFQQTLVQAKHRAGKVRYALAMWLLGLPLPIVLIALFVRGCDW